MTDNAPIPPLPNGLTFSAMQHHEVTELAEWAAAEQWNPGVADIEIAWRVDPAAFVAVRDGADMVGAGTVFSYEGRCGFMGLFIVRPEFRGHGLGTALWYRRRELMLQRLQPGAAIGMDGVFAMVPFYERGGFRLAYRDLRFDGIAPQQSQVSGGEWSEFLRGNERIVDLGVISFDVVAAFDDRHTMAPRQRFLSEWLSAPGVRGAALMANEALVGMAVLRPCRTGYRFGPVHADEARHAEALVRSLLEQVAGEAVQIDVPEPNAAALDLVARLGMRESFGCARMYYGTPPMLPVDRIFGVTSFEFG